MGKSRDKKGQGVGQVSKAKERSEKERLRKHRQRSANYCFSDADDREFEAQLEQIGCRIKFIAGDGNCLFRSLADQLEGRPEDHAAIREKIVDHLERNREMFEPYMEDDESFGDYLDRMRGDAEWGGNQELVAAGQLHKVNIIVHQLKAPRFFIACEKARLTIHLSYHGEYHYNSVRATADDGNGPALAVILQTPTGQAKEGSKAGSGLGSPWPAQEDIVSRSCPWASPANIVQALESTGGRGEDAIELLIAAKNEPALAGSAHASVDKTSANTDKGRATEETPSKAGGDGASQQKNGPMTEGGVGEPGNVNGNGKGDCHKSSPAASRTTKARKKVSRASDCPCGSGLKYKKCCRKKDAAIARGQIAAPLAEGTASSAAHACVADDLGSLVI